MRRNIMFHPLNSFCAKRQASHTNLFCYTVSMIDRTALDLLIRTDGGNNWWKPELFQKNMAALLPKELHVIAIPPSEDKNYNCFLFSLGLSNNKKILAETGGFLYSNFFDALLAEKELTITTTPKNGDYVVYQNTAECPGLYTHIGTLKDGKVISKWAWGPTIEHALLDVPASYGNDILYVQSISPKEAELLYGKYKTHNTK